MERRRRMLTLATAAVLAAALLPAWPSLAGEAGAPGPAVRVWLTTGDRSSLLAEQPRGAIGPPLDGVPLVTVDASKAYQRVEGYGASITDSSAHLLAASPYRDAIMRDLFDPGHGLGLSYLRQPMGASDFVAGDHYTYDDLPAGQNDYAMAHFSVAHDRAEILPLLRQARALNPSLKVMATPWSPPAWMKTNGSLVGGRLRDDPRVYRAYAKYFARFVEDYRRAGVPVDALTVQNEPQNRNPNAYPGMDLRPDEEARLVAAVSAELHRAGLRTRILGYDHNWSLHPNDVGPPDDPADPEYARTLLADPRANRPSPAPRSTATSATPRASPSCTTPTPTRTSTSPSAPAACRRTRRPPSRTRSTGRP